MGILSIHVFLWSSMGVHVYLRNTIYILFYHQSGFRYDYRVPCVDLHGVGGGVGVERETDRMTVV